MTWPSSGPSSCHDDSDPGRAGSPAGTHVPALCRSGSTAAAAAIRLFGCPCSLGTASQTLPWRNSGGPDFTPQNPRPDVGCASGPSPGIARRPRNGDVRAGVLPGDEQTQFLAEEPLVVLRLVAVEEFQQLGHRRGHRPAPILGMRTGCVDGCRIGMIHAPSVRQNQDRDNQTSSVGGPANRCLNRAILHDNRPLAASGGSSGT